MNPPIVMVLGYPASGKSTLTKQFEGFNILNRDTEGGSMSGLLKLFTQALSENTPLLLDNTFCKAEDRKPFIQAANLAGRSVECHWMATTPEDAQINALNRMWDRYETVFMDAAEIKAHPQAKRDPNIFPPAAIFTYKKHFSKPLLAEGFTKITKVEFARKAVCGSKKALILDYDGTLRLDAKDTGGEYHYPVNPSQVEILPNRKEVLQQYREKGYLLLGVSTQSGIARGHLSLQDAIDCFERTNELLGQDIKYRFCPHASFPVSCYCRKPQAGLGVALIREFELSPADCIYVGDLTTDKSFALRCGFQFQAAEDFFR